MSASAESTADKTHPPTAARRRRAEREGEVDASHRAHGAIAFVIFVCAVGFGFEVGVAKLFRTARSAWSLREASLSSLSSPPALSSVETLSKAGGEAFRLTEALLLWTLTPVLLGVLMFGLLQARGRFRWSAALPDPRRLLPRGPGANLDSLARGVPGAAALVGLLVLAIWMGRSWVGALPQLSNQSARGVFAAMGTMTSVVIERALWLAAIVGLVDWFLTRWRARRRLFMSDEELRRDLRESEGDPALKRERLRRAAEFTNDPWDAIQGEIALIVFGRDGDALRAVALRYRPLADRAPVVIGKSPPGASSVASAWLRSADERNIPTEEDPGLLRALSFVPWQSPIPAALFDHVAKIFRKNVSRRGDEHEAPPASL